MTKGTFGRDLVYSLAAIAVLIGLVSVKRMQADDEPSDPLERAVEVMGRTGLSSLDEDRLTAGYYESLLNEGERGRSAGRSLLSNLRSVPEAPPDWKVLAETEAARHTGGFLQYDLQPNVDIPFKGDRLRTNRWGQRDRDYELKKPARTYRIAVVASSYTMGTGVPAEQTFEALLEDELNTRRECPAVDRVEVINFSVAGYRITQELEMAVKRVPEFEPDVVVLGLNYLAVRPEWVRHLATLIRQGDDLEYEFLERIAERANLKQSDSPARLASKLSPYRTEVVGGVIRAVHAKTAERGAELVLMTIPHTQRAGNESMKDRVPKILESVGDLELPVIDLLDAFAGVPGNELGIAAWDNHPNVRGHHLLYEAIVQQITAEPRLRRLFLQCGEAGAETANPR